MSGDPKLAHELQGRTILSVESTDDGDGRQTVKLHFDDGSRLIIKKGKASCSAELTARGKLAIAFTGSNPS